MSSASPSAVAISTLTTTPCLKCSLGDLHVLLRTAVHLAHLSVAGDDRKVVMTSPAISPTPRGPRLLAPRRSDHPVGRVSQPRRSSKNQIHPSHANPCHLGDKCR